MIVFMVGFDPAGPGFVETLSSDYCAMGGTKEEIIKSI